MMASGVAGQRGSGATFRAITMPASNLIAIGNCASCFLAASILGVVMAAYLTPLEGPVGRLLGRYLVALALVWLALGAIIDVNHHLYAPR